MSTSLYYFSGTGNSLKIAKDLAEKLGDCQLVPIAKKLQESTIVADAETVGLVFPLYFWGLPEFIKEFVKKLDLRKADYLFAVLTRGGSPGHTMGMLEKLLQEKSKRLNAGFHITMPGNYIVAPYYIYSSEERQKKLFARAEQKIEEIVEIVKNRRTQVEKSPFLGEALGKLFNKLYYRQDIAGSDAQFHADDNCNGCGTCEKVCPFKNIAMMENKPQWQHKCHRCLSCIHFCPQTAIQFGTGTKGKHRYHHPDIRVKDMMIEA